MPRLNHGTLLENLVVLEVMRFLATTAETTVEFATSFAMPPSTQIWHKTLAEPGNNPRFNANVLDDLRNGVLPVGPPTSYSAILRDCLLNTAHLPVVDYAQHDAETQLYEYGGPNGALLATMLRHRQGQSIRVWSNDLTGPDARYTMINPIADATTECPRTNLYATALSGIIGGHLQRDGFCDWQFPLSVPQLVAWCGICMVRVGFLDPDSYVAGGVAGPGQVDSMAHVQWLTNLYRDALCTAGIMFFAHQIAEKRLMLIAAFHNDAVQEYPHSILFKHGNFMVGVKLRCPEKDHIPLIINGVWDSWKTWSALVGRAADGLTCYVDNVVVFP